MTTSTTTSIVLKLGTRKSLLAWAQSSWVARETERLNPGVRVELVGIETRGDRILDVSLQQVQGKEFFVAELDEALHSGRVDFTVHSMKDLSLERPEAFVLAAIPRRENPRDVLLVGPRGLEHLARGETIRIGTSSPRRIENIPAFLARALPRRAGAEPRFEFVDIRGNVNTRLSRVHEAPDHPKYLDGVVLAFAGLIRLYADAPARQEMNRLLEGVRWMVLPLRECPAAPAQGALAVECRRSDARTRELLGKLHDPVTDEHVARERELLAQWGGGCHQKFGATSVASGECGHLFYVLGKKPDGDFVSELRWPAPARPPRASGAVRAWSGLHWRAKSEDKDPIAALVPDLGEGPVFVAHSRAVTSELASRLAGARIWTSGASSWFRLAEQGLWVEGCAESQGFELLKATLSEPILRLPDGDAWTVLTHEGGRETWDFGRAVATYAVASESCSAEAVTALRGATHAFWTSGSQFEAFAGDAPRGLVHCCSPGKTLLTLRKAGLEPVVFPSHEEWEKWLK